MTTGIVRTTGAGAIKLTGSGSPTGTGSVNHGVLFENGSSITNNGYGQITINATPGANSPVFITGTSGTNRIGFDGMNTYTGNNIISADSMITATIVRGHRVASGLNGNPRFPGGTLFMQLPVFRSLGLDLSAFHLGTLNVSIAPHRYRVVKAKHTFRDLKWHPKEPAEDFSFFDVTVHREDAEPVSGLIYFPHPDTKPEHFQQPDVLELLLPWTEGFEYGMRIHISAPADQMAFDVPQQNSRSTHQP